VSAAVSRRCPEPRGRFPRVTHPCAAGGGGPPPARLACVRRAASVRPEPGSNSQLRPFVPAICWLTKVDSAAAPAPACPKGAAARAATTASRPAKRCPRRQRPAPPPAHPFSTQPTDDGKEHPRRRVQPVHRTVHSGSTIDPGIPPIAAGGLMWVRLAACQGSQRPFPTRRRRGLLLGFRPDGDKETSGDGELLDQGRTWRQSSPGTAFPAHHG
jgi:hypothetical protein